MYRRSIHALRLYILPFGFAVSFALLAILFGSHLAFSIEEANGLVCKQSNSITRARIKTNQGLDICVSGGLAHLRQGGPGAELQW